MQAGSNQVTQVMLTAASMEVKLPGVQPGQWIKLNPDFVGFYRVAYGPEDLELLSSAIKSMSLPNLDRKVADILLRPKDYSVALLMTFLQPFGCLQFVKLGWGGGRSVIRIILNE
jgi:hypothetical protein